jgi:hypothetical protein
MSGKEDTRMAKPNNSEALKVFNLRNLCLSALHVGVLIVTMFAHPIIGKPADGALPNSVFADVMP